MVLSEKVYVDNEEIKKLAEKYKIFIFGAGKDGKQIAGKENAYIAADNIEYAIGNKIPLWLFGFLY